MAITPGSFAGFSRPGAGRVISRPPPIAKPPVAPRPIAPPPVRPTISGGAGTSSVGGGFSPHNSQQQQQMIPSAPQVPQAPQAQAPIAAPIQALQNLAPMQSSIEEPMFGTISPAIANPNLAKRSLPLESLMVARQRPRNY